MAIPVIKLIKWSCEDIYYTPIINELTPEMLVHLKVTLGERYQVMDVTGGTYASGLTAILVEDRETKDRAIIYQGTIGEIIGNPFKRSTRDWMGNNLPNALGMSVGQYRDADIFYRRMVKKHGPIPQVAGNSLGGGCAAYVGTKHPDVFAISVNGAPLHKGYLSRLDKKKFNNILNIRCDGDILSRLCLLLYRGEDFPGQVYRVDRGIFSLDYGCIELCHQGANVAPGFKPQGASLSDFMVFDPLTQMPLRIRDGKPLYGKDFTPFTKDEGKAAGNLLVDKSGTIKEEIVTEIKERLKVAEDQESFFYMSPDEVESKVEGFFSGIVSLFPEGIREGHFFQKWINEIKELLNGDLDQLIVDTVFDRDEIFPYIKKTGDYLIRSLQSICKEMENIGRLLEGKSLLKVDVIGMKEEEKKALSYLVEHHSLSYQIRKGGRKFARFLKDLEKGLVSLDEKRIFKRNENMREDLIRTVRAFKQDVLCYLLTGGAVNDLYYCLGRIPYILMMMEALLMNVRGHVQVSEEIQQKERILEKIPSVLEAIDELKKDIYSLLR